MKKKLIINSLYLFLLGVLSSFSLPPYNYFLINFFTFSLFFIFLFKNLEKSSFKKFLFYGWLFGYGYFLSSLYWISISLTFDNNFRFLIPISIIIIPALLALFYSLISFIFYLIRFKNILSAFFLFSLLFGVIEFTRGHILTGFPWNLIVYSLSKELNFISIISIIGTYSLNLLIISLFTLPAILILKKSSKNILVCIAFLILPIIFFYHGLNIKRDFFNSPEVSNNTTIRIIGSNISLDRYYKENQSENVLKELIKISNPDPNKKTFFIWPEGIIPDIYQDELFLYKDVFGKNFNQNHIIALGINNRQVVDGKEKFFNSLSIFDGNLNLIKNYNKINLVPFGEFLPLEKILNKVGLKTVTNNYQSYTRGKKRDVISINNNLFKLDILPLICYEIIYSGSISKNDNFDFILNISEDGWFGESIGPKQHFVHGIFRAIENGKYVIRSANNGIAAIINPIGLIEKKVNFGDNGYVDFEDRRNNKPTPFSTYGNKIFSLFILLYIFLIILFNKIKNE